MKLLYLACLAVGAIFIGYDKPVLSPIELVAPNDHTPTLTSQTPPSFILDPYILDPDRRITDPDESVASHHVTGNVGSSLDVNKDVNYERSHDGAHVGAPGDR